MKWLLEHFLPEDLLVKEAAEKLGLEVEVNTLPTTEAARYENYGLLHASIGVTKQVQNHVFHLTPWKSLRFQDYAGYWHKFLFNQEYIMLPAGTLMERWGWDREGVLVDRDLFLRPDTNDKLFNGGVYCYEDFERLFNGYQVQPSTLVVAAPAYKIRHEWRCFMHQGRLLDVCCYRRDGKRHIEAGVEETVKEFAESVPMYPGLPPVYVLDVCDGGDGYRILETGSVNVAGLYACDPVKILPALVLETTKLYEETL